MFEEEGTIVKLETGLDEWLLRAGLSLFGLYLLVVLVFPVAALLSKSLFNKNGDFIGLANYFAYFSNPALVRAIYHSLFIAGSTTLINVVLAFSFAYGLTRSCMPCKHLFKAIAMAPILVPSLLPGIAMIYLFGHQGLLKALLGGHSIYGPLGIIVAEAFHTFPHSVIIISTALTLADARLYEAALTLGAGKLRIFRTVTLPGVRYGLLGAAFVVFTLTITDFGVPQVIGGRYEVLALDLYRQVLGRQNFEMGAVVGVVLMLPTLLAFLIDRHIQRRQMALLSTQTVPHMPRPNRRFDRLMLGYCSLIGVFILGIIGMCQYATLVELWPYKLSLSLKNYHFGPIGGWASYFNSLRLALYTALFGTVIVFIGAYLVEKGSRWRRGRTGLHLLAMLPLAVPGMVLGLAYIFFFNSPYNPLHGLYGTMAILVISTITNYYTVAHLTAVTALKQLDPEFEAVSASLKQPAYTVFLRVTVPVCLPAILEIAAFLFVRAMTTVAVVVFLYSPATLPAAVAILNLEDAGLIAPAAAIGMMIFYTNAGVRLLHGLLSQQIDTRWQRWRSGRSERVAGRGTGRGGTGGSS